MTLPSLVAFGAIAPWPGPAKLAQLRRALQQLESLKPVIESLQELPLLWEVLAKQDSNLNDISGRLAAEHLGQWITGNCDPQLVEDYGNVMKMPLTIVTQIAYYISYLRQCDEGITHESLMENLAIRGGVQGFCIGVLSALAVSSAKTEAEVGRYTATSLRLAFCIGAYVDLDQSRNDGDSKVSTLAVRWKPPITLEDIQGLLSNYPHTYIAVFRDVRDLTITTSASALAHVLEDLSQIGASVRDTGVSGRYHAAIHEGIPEKILAVCQTHFVLDFDSGYLVRSNTDAQPFPNEGSTLLALKSILGERADWYATMSKAVSALSLLQEGTSPLILSIGTDPIPQSIAKSFPTLKPTLFIDEFDSTKPSSEKILMISQGYPDDAIAIIGMGCRFAGAESIDDYWNILTEGKSMLSEVPESRFGKGHPVRSSSSLRFWGNFLQDIEAWDHGFFKKSSREATSMDPQQRILLQIAYEALETSGYFADSPNSRPEDVGCYIGACAVDYDFNVASHPPSAYSATGTLRSFVSGKLSHYFGWSGPSLVLDTACSSSAVAIHTACTALRTNQCSQALAGGITLMTSPYLYENFSTAHFLSPTGASKPFSANADGYCRGEGGGLVVLKRLSDALRDNDHIFGVIGGSAVNQNDNCVPITVPHTSSQGNLYEKVARQAGVRPSKIDFVVSPPLSPFVPTGIPVVPCWGPVRRLVFLFHGDKKEAHGTGTPVGDPIEMESIRRIFGGADRDRGAPLIVSSAKGNIGHTEGASGVAALIKAVLQIENRLATRQASFTTLNPKIPALGPDNLCVPTSNLALSGERLTACINNYGAAGSNAALILLQGPRKSILPRSSAEGASLRPKKYPVQLAAASSSSLVAYCKTLEAFCAGLRSAPTPPDEQQLLSSLVSALAVKLNQGLSSMFTTSVTDLDQLMTELRQQTAVNNNVRQRPKEPPVVLCFGGQVSDRVALDKSLWYGSTLLRSHLDTCEDALRKMGFPGIYPSIFWNEPITDVVLLHSAIFALQYSCAKAWLECGLKVSALVGHSFGQLTAWCVSGILTLSDGLKLVAGRASLMQKHWGFERGTMIAIEADRESLEGLQSSSGGDVDFEIACYNGPSSHVAVSDQVCAAKLEVKLGEQGMRYRRLNVPYGFHSRFTEPLLPDLEDLASSLGIHEPTIPVETCTHSQSWTKPTAQLICAHTRKPVFFGQAIQRLEAKLGPSTWLEAGSDSSVVNMARRALGQSSVISHSFVSLQLNKQNSTNNVVDATIALWNSGHHIQFWNFHRLERPNYDYLRVPSYVWDNSKHWLNLDMSAALSTKTEVPATTTSAAQVEQPPVLIRLKSTDSRGHHFIVDPRSEEFQTIVQGLISSGTAVCPPTLYVELASRAVRTAEEDIDGGLLLIQDLQVHSLQGLDQNRIISLDIQQSTQGWKFRMSSNDSIADSFGLGSNICHAEGVVTLRPANSSLAAEFSRYERLIGYADMASIANNPRSESLKGNVMYKMLAQTITYPDWYRAVRSVTALDSKVVAKVSYPAGIPKIISKGTTIHLPILESFIQVASVHANCLCEHDYGKLLQLSRAESVQFGSSLDVPNLAAISWDVMAYSSIKDGGISYDIFIFDAATGRLMLLILGAHFASLCQLSDVPQASDVGLKSVGEQLPAGTDPKAEKLEDRPASQPTEVSQLEPNSRKPDKEAKTSIYHDICGLLEKLADIPQDQVSGDQSFDDVGVDSLMMIEVITELSNLFRVELPVNELEELTDINSLVDYLHRKGCVSTSCQDNGDVSSRPDPNRTPSSDSSSDSGFSGGTAMSTPASAVALADRDDLSNSKSASRAASTIPDTIGNQPLQLGPYGLQDVFQRLRFDFEKHAEQVGAKGFWADVYPEQADLVCAYVVDAYHKLGCDIVNLAPGQQLCPIETLPRHRHLVAQLQNILVDSGLLELSGMGSSQGIVRSTRPFDAMPTGARHERMLQRHPLYACDTDLLRVAGARLAECLTGQLEPLSLLFGDKHHRELLSSFYSNSSMLRAATRLLMEFVESVFSAKQSGNTLCLLEVGAGTGGTTKHLVEMLTQRGVPFEYYFTDISSSLVSQARKRFSSFQQMKFMTFDCDGPPPTELVDKFHIVISTNCIHATSNLTKSTANILPTIRSDGALCLLEFTRNLYWFDLVFGLLEGWWLATDGRQHPLANEWFWDSKLRMAGFKHVSWTDGNAEEAKTLRLICAFRGDPRGEQALAPPPSGRTTKRAGVPMEEIVWKRVGALELSVDVYFPKMPDPPGKKRPLALLLHGGGHVLFGRKDVPMKHIRTLIEHGYLPISTDYRLVPETNLFDGPMTDTCDALEWAREVLPSLTLSGPAVRPDPNKVVALGWSSGGQLAMSLGYLAPPRGIRAPDAILAMYPPSDMESDHWHKPCYPLAAEEKPGEIVDILAGVHRSPILEYAPFSEKRTLALSLTVKDPRAKIILHTCWNSQTLPILVNGLPHKDSISDSNKIDWRYPPAATDEQVQAISPLWHIRQGDYKTPTYIIHGNADDWLPLSMNEMTVQEMKDRGIPAGLAVPEQCRHAFDLFPVGDPLGVGWAAVEKGYEFLRRQLALE